MWVCASVVCGLRTFRRGWLIVNVIGIYVDWLEVIWIGKSMQRFLIGCIHHRIYLYVFFLSIYCSSNAKSNGTKRFWKRAKERDAQRTEQYNHFYRFNCIQSQRCVHAFNVDGELSIFFRFKFMIAFYFFRFQIE